jgi:hypothetical protein
MAVGLGRITNVVSGFSSSDVDKLIAFAERFDAEADALLPQVESRSAIDELWFVRDTMKRRIRLLNAVKSLITFVETEKAEHPLKDDPTAAVLDAAGEAQRDMHNAERNNFEDKVFDLIFNKELSYGKAAKELGYSRSYMRQVVQRMIRRMRGWSYDRQMKFREEEDANR